MIIYLGNNSINADNSDPIVKLNGYPLSGRCFNMIMDIDCINDEV